MLSVCGIICNDCEFFKTKCPGCYVISGKPFWVKESGKKICEIYDCCVKRHGFNNCGQCEKVPCDLLKSLKPDGISQEEHLANLEKQVKRFAEDLCPCPSTFCAFRGDCRICYESHHDINSLPVCLR